MEEKCPNCGNAIPKRISSYHYKESGLNNVYLENIPAYECSCGVSYASIFRLLRLNDLIARTLLRKPALLNGEEIRFLRKNIYLSSKTFSKTLGIGKTTLSKWENDIQQHSEKNDRLIRAAYMILKGITGKEAQKLFRYLAKIQLKKSDIDSLITAEKLEGDYIVTWRPVVGSRADKTASIYMLPQDPLQVITYHEMLLVCQPQIESDVQFSSLEVLSTKTNPHGPLLEEQT